EETVKGTPIEFLEIYTDCWKLNPDSRPSIDQIFSRMQSMSFEQQHDSDKDSAEEIDLFKIWKQKAIIGEFFTYIKCVELARIYKVSNDDKSENIISWEETFLDIERGYRRLLAGDQSDQQVSKI